MDAHPATCPWDGLRAWSGPPNVDWCEPTRCGWIGEPSNTWSNLAFIAVAAFIWWHLRRTGTPERSLRFFAPAAFWVGATSLAYHASNTFATQVLDFFGMYFFFVLICVLNLIRLGVLRKERIFVTLWPAIAFFTLLTVAVAKLGLPVQAIIGGLLLGAIATEVLASRRSASPVQHRYFGMALGTIGMAGTFSALDVSRTWCQPENLVLHGHAVWHVLSALALLWSYLYYRQFREQLV